MHCMWPALVSGHHHAPELLLMSVSLYTADATSTLPLAPFCTLQHSRRSTGCWPLQVHLSCKPTARPLAWHAASQMVPHASAYHTPAAGMARSSYGTPKALCTPSSPASPLPPHLSSSLHTLHQATHMLHCAPGLACTSPLPHLSSSLYTFLATSR
jgi:hypothetical protein